MQLQNRVERSVGSIIGLVGLTILMSGNCNAAEPSQPPKPVNLDVSGWYFSGKGGPSLSYLRGVESTSGGTVSKDSAVSGIGAFGMALGYEWMYRYGVPLRTEFEFMNRTEVTYNASPHLTGASSGALASTAQNVTAMVKGYWHFPVNSATWWPFVSAGIGWSHNTLKSQFTSTGGTATKNTHITEDLAWSVGAGISVKMGPNMVNDIEIRQVSLGQPNWGLPGGADIETGGFMGYGATEISFALRFKF